MSDSIQVFSDAVYAKQIRCLISDVDGVMTDGRITYNAAGVETKSFHVRDGVGIRRWLDAGRTFILLTGRTSVMVDRRAQELGVTRVIQGRDDKWAAASAVLKELSIDPSAVCHLGDDLPDVSVMRRVGLSVAPADASADAASAAIWTTRAAGGQGVVREVTERLLRASGQWEISAPASHPDPESIGSKRT